MFKISIIYRYRFIKQNEEFDDKNNPKLKIVKLSDNDFLIILDNSISFGYSLLIEKVGEELDSSLDSLLINRYLKMPEFNLLWWKIISFNKINNLIY